MTPTSVVILVAVFLSSFLAHHFGALHEKRRGQLRLEIEARRAERAEESLKTANKSAALEVGHAFEQARKVVEEARLAMAEARGTMKEAVDLIKRASQMILGDVPDTVPPPSTVSDGDRQVMRQRKEQSQATK